MIERPAGSLDIEKQLYRPAVYNCATAHFSSSPSPLNAKGAAPSWQAAQADTTGNAHHAHQGAGGTSSASNKGSRTNSLTTSSGENSRRTSGPFLAGE